MSDSPPIARTTAEAMAAMFVRMARALLDGSDPDVDGARVCIQNADYWRAKAQAAR